MENRYDENGLERIFEAVKKLEKVGKKTLTNELENLREICDTYYNIVDRSFGTHNVSHDIYINHVTMELPMIFEFLGVVKHVSEEAYQFLTEGHDLLNLRYYLAFHKRNVSNVLKKAHELSSFCEFFEHSILKLVREPNEEKKRLMIRGLVGM